MLKVLSLETLSMFQVLVLFCFKLFFSFNLIVSTRSPGYNIYIFVHVLMLDVEIIGIIINIIQSMSCALLTRIISTYAVHVLVLDVEIISIIVILFSQQIGLYRLNSTD